MAEYDTQEEGGLIDRIKESPRTVSALIIILIVAAAIYAFSGEENQINGETGSEAATTEEAADGDAANNDQEETLDTTGKEAGASDDTKTTGGAKRDGTTKGATSTPLAESSPTPLPEPQRTASSFIEVAETGNGITHLARKASSRWLSENQAGYAVTDEHRIYIEDYIQNKLGTRGLEIGETMEISFDLIQEAVAAAGELNEMELRGLSQYTGVLK